MRDYTKIEKYKGQTPLDAQFHYMRDLLSEVCMRNKRPDGTCNCPFPNMMKPAAAKCCGWLADGDTERAITMLEIILDLEYKPEFDTPDNVRAIAAQNGVFAAQSLLQEECAELIQAVSKKQRGPTAQTLDHLIEEMADVSIMLDEVACLIPNGHELLRRRRDEKVGRTLDRLRMVRQGNRKADAK